MQKELHPEQALFSEGRLPPLINVCEHFAGKEKYILKALELQRKLGSVFDLTCDLEDGAERGKEKEQLDMVIDLLRSVAPGEVRIGIRVREMSFAKWEEELQILAKEIGTLVRYVTIPKLRSFAEVSTAARTVQKIFRANAKAVMPIHALIETHGALRDVWQIAESAEVECLDFGHMDFIAAHGGAIGTAALNSPGQFEHALLRRAKAEICAAALANAKVPTHNVTIDYTRPEQAGEDARRAREEFGFMRMWSIHPEQIEPIVKAFQPDEGSLRTAEQVLLAGQAADWGPIAHQEKLYDRASYRLLWTILKRGHVTKANIGDLARRKFFAE